MLSYYVCNKKETWNKISKAELTPIIPFTAREKQNSVGNKNDSYEALMSLLECIIALDESNEKSVQH